MVKESFVSCAITTSTNGCDDDKIHCFRSSQPCESGRSLLDTETQKLLTALMDNEDNDPFAWDTDGEGAEMNEVLIDEEDIDVDESEDDVV